MMEIYTDVPVPYIRGKYPWALMGVGNSMKFDDRTKFKGIRSSAETYGRKHGWKFTSRTVDGTLWIWRVK